MGTARTERPFGEEIIDPVRTEREREYDPNVNATRLPRWPLQDTRQTGDDRNRFARGTNSANLVPPLLEK